MTLSPARLKSRVLSALAKLAAVSLVLALLGGGLWWQRMAIVLGLLQYSPFAIPKLAGLFFDANRAEIAELSFSLPTDFGELDLDLKGLSANYDLHAGKIQDINIAEAELNLNYQATETAKTADNDKPIALPLDSLRIGKLTLSVNTPWGLSQFNGAFELQRGAGDSFTLKIEDARQKLHLDFEPDLANAKLDIAQTKGGKVLAITVTQREPDRPRIQAAGELAGLATWLNGNTLLADGLQSKLRALKLADIASSLAGMQLSLDFSGPDNSGNAAGQFAVTDRQRRLLDGNFKVSRQPGLTVSSNLTLQIAAVRALELAKPALPESVNTWQVSGGDLDGTADLHWQSGRPVDGQARLQARALDLAIGTVAINKAELAAELTDLAQQSVKLTAHIPNLELGKTLTAAKLDLAAGYQNIDRVLALENATLAIFGGSVTLAPGHFVLTEPSSLVTVNLQDIDLSQLLASLDYPDLSGTGRLYGSLPITVSATGVDLQDGKLTGAQPGVLRYLGKAADPNNLAFQALRNLMYQGLQAKLSYRPNGDYHLGLRLEGHNPQVLSGHPLAFNLNISGQLPELLQKGLLAGDFEKAVIQQAISQPTAPDQPLEPPPADRRKK